MEKEKKEKSATRIVFAPDEEVRERKERIKQFHNANVRSYLLNDEYEISKAITDLMVLEGLSDSFIDDLVHKETDDAYALSLDYLHAAALIMGEAYVRENLLGKTVPAAEASEAIRTYFHETQLESFRKIYENLDDKIKVALEGETKVDHQIEVLKIQSENAKKMYQQKMQSVILQHEYEKKLLRASHELEKQHFKDRLVKMEASFKKARKEAQELEKEKEELIKSIRSMDQPHGLFCFRKKEAPKGKTEKGKEAVPQIETEESKQRRLFCYSVLGNKNFTPQQIELLLPCLKDEAIPLVILQKLCVPDLPTENMKSFIRYIRKDDGKNEDEL